MAKLGYNGVSLCVIVALKGPLLKISGFRFLVFVFSLVFSAIPTFAQNAPNVYAITDAKIVVGDGKIIEKGTIVLRDGLIVAVGKDVKAPADARILSGEGLTVYPGLVDASAKTGMPAAADYPKEARGGNYAVPKVRADIAATALYKPDPAATEARRKLGFGAMLVAPQVGLFKGTSALFSTGPETDVAQLTIKPVVASHIDWAAEDASDGYPESLMGSIAAIRQFLFDVADADGKMLMYNKISRKTVRPVVSRQILAFRSTNLPYEPLIIAADSAADMRRAIKLSQEFRFHLIIEGGREAYKIASELKAADASILLSTALPEPPKLKKGEEDPTTLEGFRYRASVPRTAAALAKAGVPFAFTTKGLENVADFPKNVRKFIAAGLTEDAAVEAATTGAARILKVDRQLGTLEVGKIANVVGVSDGTLFGPKSKVKYVFVDGKQAEIDAAKPVATAATKATEIPLPPGVTKEMALGMLKSQPDAAAPYLPAGVTVEQAIAVLEGKTPPAPPADGKKESDDAPKAPPVTGTGLIPPLPPAVASAFVLRGATIWTAGPQGTLPNADIYIRDGKIVAVGAALKVPAGTAEIDAKGKQISPGMIDCHSHTAIDGGVNEGTNIVTAECRIEDVIDAEDVNIYRQLAGGTTAANLLHGSANAIGGQNAVVKWRWGKTPDEMRIAGAPPGIKFALGENPKQSNFSFPGQVPRYPATRMGVEKVIREAFLKAKDYQRQQQYARAGRGEAPRRDLQLDALVEIMEGKRFVHSHCYRQDEILMLMRLAEEFGFRVRTFQHVLEGYKVADEMAKHGVGGSTFSDWWAFKVEAYDAIPYNGALMTARGVTVSFNSDDSELARRLNLEAAKAVKYGGVSPDEAIKFDTINPARQLGIDKMTGSLEPGKDADLVVWSGSPLSSLGVCEKTFVDGVLYFDRAADIAARPVLEAEKKRLAAYEKPEEKPDAKKPAPATPKPAVESVTIAGNLKTVADNASPALAANAALTPNVSPARNDESSRTFTPSTIPVKTASVGDKIVRAIVGGTVHTVSGATIPDGVVIMENGKITAVGPASAVTVPGAAEKINAAGLHVYPGLFDADTTLGVTEIDSIRATNDYRELGPFNPDLKIVLAVNPDSERIGVTRQGGVLNVVTAPAGGTLSGMGGVLCLDGWTWEDMAVAPISGLYLNYPSVSQRRFRETSHRCEETSGSTDDELDSDPAFRSGAFIPAGSRDTEALRFGYLPNTAFGSQPPRRRPRPVADPTASLDDEEKTALKPLNAFFDDAKRYRDARDAESQPGILAHNRDPKFEGMLPVLAGTVPVFVRADREKDIRSAVRWAKSEGVRIVIVGGQEADKCADLLAAEKIPVILGPVLELPRASDAPYDDAFTIPAKLSKAGVTFCLSTGDSANVRRLPNHAAMAAAFGLSPDEALKAITLYPAQIVGVSAQLGSLDAGKQADIILTNGDILEVSTQIKAAYIAGTPVDLTNKQTRLYEKYKARPKR